jgi:hypothetical protein
MSEERQATSMNQSVTSVTSEKLPCFAETTEAVDRDGQKRCIPRAEGVDKENLHKRLHQGETRNAWKTHGISALKETAS